MSPGSPFRELLGPPAEMFRFFRGDPVRTRRIMDIGVFPWWTDPTLKAEFLQALTVLTHRLDYTLWPDSPVLMHAQSLFWLGIAVAAVAVFYRRMLGPTWVAAVAALLYAVDDARGPTVGFIANRNVLIAAAFGVWALICHDYWRRGGSRPAAFLAPLLLAAALFSKEEGIGTCAYLAAYGLFADRAGRWRGCVALSPYVAVVLVWRALRDHWGYGVQNMGLYVDPLTDPGPFMEAARRACADPDARPVGPGPGGDRRGASSAVFDCLLDRCGRFCRPARPRARPTLEARSPGPILGGWDAVYSPQHPLRHATADGPALDVRRDRSAFGLLAQFFVFVFGSSRDGSSMRWWRIAAPGLAWFFVAVHVVWAPLAFPFRAANPLGARWVEQRLYVRTPLPGPAIGKKTLVIVNAPSPVNAGYVRLPAISWVVNPSPATFACSQAGHPRRDHSRRLDEYTLEIRPPAAGYIDWLLTRTRVFRSGAPADGSG